MSAQELVLATGIKATLGIGLSVRQCRRLCELNDQIASLYESVGHPERALAYRHLARECQNALPTGLRRWARASNHGQRRKNKRARR